MFANNQGLVRITNQNLIMNALRSQSLARIDLSRKLEMSGPSVSKHVDLLIDRQLIVESEAQSSGLGRRRVLLKFNEKRGYVCAVELCAHTARLALADLGGTLLEQAELDPYENLDSLVLARVVKQLGKLLGNHTQDTGKLLGVCLMNGHVPRHIPDDPTDMVKALTELEKLILGKYDCPVFLEHSTRMAAVGESIAGERNTGTVFYVYVGDTVSGSMAGWRPDGGVNWENPLFGGLDEMIPDAVSAVAEWRSGGHSKRNTLGEQVSLFAVLRTVTEKFIPGEGYLGEQFEEADAITPDDIRTGAEKGDSSCLFAIQNAAVRLAVSIVNFSRILDFDEVVVGGSIDRLGNAYFNTVVEFLTETVLRTPPLVVRRSVLRDSAMLYGGIRRASDGAIHTLIQSIT